MECVTEIARFRLHRAAVWMARSPVRNNTVSDQQQEDDDSLIWHTDISNRAIYSNTLNTHRRQVMILAEKVVKYKQKMFLDCWSWNNTHQQSDFRGGSRVRKLEQHFIYAC